MGEHDELGRTLRQILLPNMTDEQASIDRLRDRLDKFISDDELPSSGQSDDLSDRGRKPLRRTRRVLVLAAVAATLAAGIAVAADQGILFSDKPTTDRLHVLGSDAPTDSQVPEAEIKRYSILKGAIPVSAGARLDDHHARLLISYKDGAHEFRLVAVATTTGALCYETLDAALVREHIQGSHSCGAFRPGWPLIESTRGINDGVDYYYGIAADEVDHVNFRIGDKQYPATMGHNAYVWAPPDRMRAATVEVVFHDGSVARRNLEADPAHDAYQEPFVVHTSGRQGAAS